MQMLQVKDKIKKCKLSSTTRESQTKIHIFFTPLNKKNESDQFVRKILYDILDTIYSRPNLGIFLFWRFLSLILDGLYSTHISLNESILLKAKDKIRVKAAYSQNLKNEVKLSIQ